MKIQIEMFINNSWISEIRYYIVQKDLSAFDLCDIPNKRRNAIII